MSTNDCEACQRLIDRRADGDPAAVDDAACELHVSECPTCAAYAAGLEALLATAAELKQVDYPREITLAPLVIGSRRRRATWPLLAGLATASLALVVGVVIGRGSGPSGQPAPALQSSRPPSAMPAAASLVRFVVPAPGAREVAVLGDFTGWRDPIPLTAEGEGLWVGELALPAGRYQYVIVVDGEHLQPDPAARQVVDDGFGGQSSVLTVGSL